jgi:hypothetical protein
MSLLHKVGAQQEIYYMANPAIDLMQRKFGYLTVIARAGTSVGKAKKARWLCLCDCGNITERESQYLRAKHRKYPRSCGCHHGNETHKMSYHQAYSNYQNMILRCHNPSNKDYKNYGARGIAVCESWRYSFAAFWLDMGPVYKKGLTLDRIDNNGPYSPENCRWATAEQQGLNKRTNVLIDTPKGLMPIAQAAKAYGIKPITLRRRLKAGWPVEIALMVPPDKSKKLTTYLTADPGLGLL